jgi:hypothetical protein
VKQTALTEMKVNDRVKMTMNEKHQGQNQKTSLDASEH